MSSRGPKASPPPEVPGSVAEGTVLLRAENIDLRDQLAKAHARIDELNLMVTQATIHMHGLPGSPEDYVKIDEYEKLEQQLDESMQREAELRACIEKLRSERGDSEGRAAAAQKTKIAELEKELEQRCKTKNQDDVALSEARQKVRDCEKSRDQLRRQVDELTKKNNSLEQAVGELNAAMEGGKVASSPVSKSDLAVQVDIAVPSGDGASHADASGGAKGGKMFTAVEVQKKLDEVREEVMAKAEEEAFQISLELQEKIDQLEATVKSLKEELKKKDEQAVASAAATPRATPTSAGSASSQELEKAIAERNIAVRVKDGALKECANVKAELQRCKNELEALKKGGGGVLREVYHSHEVVGTAGGKDDEDEHTGDESAMISHLRRQLDDRDQSIQRLEKNMHKLEDEVATLRVKVTTKKDKDDAAAQLAHDEAQMFREELLKAKELLEKAESDLRIANTEKDRAQAAGRRAFLERNSALTEAKKAQQEQENLRRLQRTHNEDTTTTKALFSEVQSQYEAIVEKIEKAETPDARREVMYDVLFEYERKLWHLNNDLKSAATVRILREADTEQLTSNAWAAKCEEYMSAIEILRMQITELGEKPRL